MTTEFLDDDDLKQIPFTEAGFNKLIKQYKKLRKAQMALELSLKTPLTLEYILKRTNINRTKK